MGAIIMVLDLLIKINKIKLNNMISKNVDYEIILNQSQKLDKYITKKTIELIIDVNPFFGGSGIFFEELLPGDKRVNRYYNSIVILFILRFRTVPRIPSNNLQLMP